MADKSYNISTGLKTIYNVYSGLGSPHCFYINNIEASGLYLEKGKTYEFIQTGTSNSDNPLNIYLDEYGNKKLTKYVTVSGTAGVDRYITISIPKSFKETNTLYYGNESGEFFGAPIKLISNEYYLKYNIQLYCFNVKHDNEKYIIPQNILTDRINYNDQYNLESGILPYINKNNSMFKTSYSQNIRTDVLNLNLFTEDNFLLRDSDNFTINFFGNNLTYKKIKTNSNDWSNLYDLYNLVSELCFADSGSLEIYQTSEEKYYQYGYQLSGCEGCIDKIILNTGINNIYSGSITLIYNPTKIYNNYNSYPLFNPNSQSIVTESFIIPSYKLSDKNFKYSIYTGDGAFYV